MKKIISILLIAMGLISFSYAGHNEFCAGFKRGYIRGYKQATGSSLNPLTPLCPLQPLKGFGDPKSDFEHGYIIGLKHGMLEGTDRY